jgi:hypothetical protein
MPAFNPLAREFIAFCINRCGNQWPGLYDEMCWVAGHRLFHGMGYRELNRVGLSLGLNDIENTLQMVDKVIAQQRD